MLTAGTASRVLPVAHCVVGFKMECSTHSLWLAIAPPAHATPLPQQAEPALPAGWPGHRRAALHAGHLHAAHSRALQQHGTATSARSASRAWHTPASWGGSVCWRPAPPSHAPCRWRLGSKPAAAAPRCSGCCAAAAPAGHPGRPAWRVRAGSWQLARHGQLDGAGRLRCLAGRRSAWAPATRRSVLLASAVYQ